MRATLSSVRFITAFSLFFSFLVPSFGFVQDSRFRGPLGASPTGTKSQRYSKQLYTSNKTSTEEGTQLSEHPLQPFLEFWGTSTTSSAYRTFLLTGALFATKSVREFLGIPGCFLVGSAAFFTYYYETKFNYLVDIVTPERQAALKAIRQYKTDQLSSMSHADDNDLPYLLDAYEKVLREELMARVIIPPNIWVIEMDPNQEDRFAAPQFLGLEITDKYTLEPKK